MFYLNQWGTGPICEYSEEDALTLVLRLLTSAAEFDSATGGVNPQAKLYPVVKRITAQGVQPISVDLLKDLYSGKVAGHV